MTIRSRTAITFAAIAVGILAGLALRAGSLPGTSAFLTVLELIIRAWTNAFRLLVLPLIFAQLYLTVAQGSRTRRDAGRLALLVPLVFTGLWAATALLAIVTGSGLLALPWARSISLPTTTGSEAEVRGPIDPASPADWVDSVIPPNLFAALSGGAIIPLMVVAVVLGLASRRQSEGTRVLSELLEAIRGACFVVVDWLIWLAPLVVFAVAIVATGRAGLGVAGALLTFTVLESLILLVALAALYPLVLALGRVGLRSFSRAVWPAQLVAVSTRSSLATIPALLKGAGTLPLRPADSAVVIPLAGAALKLSRAVSDPITLLFLAHALSIPLSLPQIIVFTATIFLLSPSSLGVPRATSGTMSLPVYIALGIPPVYVVLLAATTVVADVFMTLLNTTGYLAADVLVGRFAAETRETPRAEAA